MLSTFVTILILLVSGYFIFKYANKVWQKVDVEEKLEDVKITHEKYETVKNVDTKKFKKEQKEINKILDS